MHLIATTREKEWLDDSLTSFENKLITLERSIESSYIFVQVSWIASFSSFVDQFAREMAAKNKKEHLFQNTEPVEPIKKWRRKAKSYKETTVEILNFP